jgi:hypothetical protein
VSKGLELIPLHGEACLMRGKHWINMFWARAPGSVRLGLVDNWFYPATWLHCLGVATHELTSAYAIWRRTRFHPVADSALLYHHCRVTEVPLLVSCSRIIARCVRILASWHNLHTSGIQLLFCSRTLRCNFSSASYPQNC